MGKRSNGEGTISKRINKDGKVVGWRTAISVGYDSHGKLVRRWVSGRTQAEVQAALRALQSEAHQGLLTDTKDLTLGAFLQQWLDSKERTDVKPNTLRSYRDTVRLYINPYLGTRKLEKLRVLDIEHLMGQLRKDGKSAAVQSYTLRVLKMALRSAVHWQLLARNVAEVIHAPRKQKAEMQVWTAAQVAQFLRVAAGHRLYAAFFLTILTGMRRGEVLGLQWKNIDWERKRLKVRDNLVEVRQPGKPGKKHAGKETVSSTVSVLQTLKTPNSRRTIPLSPGTMQELEAHRRRQQAEWEMIGESWKPEGFVFTDVLGRPVEPRTLYGWYRQLVEEAGVPRIRFHDLRHTAASLMIHNGINAKTVSDRLGHADVAFTLRVYAHLYDEQREEAAFDLPDLYPESFGDSN